MQAGTAPAEIALANVTRQFGNSVAVQDLSFEVGTSEIVALLGRTGAGKSTAMNLIMGNLKATSGTVRVAGFDPYEEFGRLRGTLAVSFQTDRLLPWRTAVENIELGLQILRVDKADGRRRASEWLTRVKMAGADDKYPHELSGGMRQRVSIARALLGGPRVLLMDEPFGALDEITRDRLNEELLRIWRETGTTIVFVTHSIYEAAFLGQQVLMLAARPGRVREIVTIDLPEPRHLSMRETAAFTAQAAHLRAVLETC
jgi:NitT/TauT family transport system ATP-binding protein